MNFSRGRKTEFEEADRRYAELRRGYEAGQVSPEEFDAQLKQIMLQDPEGRWWAKSRASGEWFYHDGNDWMRGTPPGYQQKIDPDHALARSNKESALRESSQDSEAPGGSLYRTGVLVIAILFGAIIIFALRFLLVSVVEAGSTFVLFIVVGVLIGVVAWVVADRWYLNG